MLRSRLEPYASIPRGAEHMGSKPQMIVVLGAMVLVVACGQSMDEGAMDAKDNVLLAEWTGPHGGVPAFDNMDLDALKPALEAGMAMNLEEIDVIADNPEPPTFENTILEMERTGQELDRVFPYYGIWTRNLSTPAFRAIQ
jgi:peptidyl-dipeptidase Dcp